MDEHEHYGPGQPMNAADVAAIIAERDRLRAVVDAVRALFAEPVEPGEWAAADLGTEPYNRLLAALAALDGSADMGDEPLLCDNCGQPLAEHLGLLSCRDEG
jgi:hypothetical protein